MPMDIQAGIGGLTSYSFWRASQKSISCYPCSSSKIFCSKNDSRQPQQNGDNKGAMPIDKRTASVCTLSALATNEKYVTFSFLLAILLVLSAGIIVYRLKSSFGDKFSTDWDKAWSNFRKQSKKSFFSQFSPDKYVTWNPRQSNYPLSEEVDPIKRTERSNLMLWTSPGFTLVVAIIIVTFLLLYTILAPVK